MSFVIPSLESPPPSPSVPAIDVQLTSLLKFLWTPLLMEAPFSDTPQQDCRHIPQSEASLGNLGNESGKLIIKVACKVYTWQTIPMTVFFMTLFLVLTSGVTRSHCVHAQCLVVPFAGRLWDVGVSTLCACVCVCVCVCVCGAY